MHDVICTGNVGSKDTLSWLRSLSSDFHMVRGDEDEVKSNNDIFSFILGKRDP